jgi:pimeloyl-ACP methyl ester carboxylesterase
MWQWEELMRLLPESSRWLAVDLPGHGDNPLPAETPLNEVAAWALEFIAAVSPGRQLVIVAHSLSGPVAIRLATMRSGRIAALVLLATAARIAIDRELLRRLSSGDLDAGLVTSCFAGPLHPERLAMLLRDLGRLRLDDEANDIWGTRSMAEDEPLASIALPALILLAAKDRVISPRKSRELGRLLSARCVVFDGVGHYLHLEDPIGVARELVQFQGQLVTF